jgi:Na+-translocating ferredoxin:NAD+ oxidoreductase subunit C
MTERYKKRYSELYQELTNSAIGSFHGGIHPNQFKSMSNQRPISTVPLVEQLIIPIEQHAGMPSQIDIEVGQQLEQNQLIAKASSTISANIHTPYPSLVTAIKPMYAGHSSGLSQICAVLTVDSNQQPIETVQATLKPDKQKFDYKHLQYWLSLSSEQILQQILSAGIVGLGGAAFPTHIKLAAKPIHTLIINAMECEPYITCDDRLIQEQAYSIIKGALLAARAVQAENILFAVEDNKPEAINALKQAIEVLDETVSRFDTIDDCTDDLKPLSKQSEIEPTEIEKRHNDENQIQITNIKIPNIKIVIAPTKYPSGGEKQTIELVLGQQVPKGERPSAIGVILQNVATCFAIFQAVEYEQPLTHRVVTLTGDLISKPGNYWLPIGLKINDLIEVFDIDKNQLCQVICGGPLMGKPLTNFEAPILKSTNCLIFNHNPETSAQYSQSVKSHQACIRCGDCDKVCPVELLPQQLYWFSQSDQWQAADEQGLFDCIECGACTYVCPSEIPLVDYYRYAKSVIVDNKRKQQLAEDAKQRYEFRQQRLIKQKQQRALKKKKADDARKLAALEDNKDPSGKKTAINQALERVRQKKLAEQKKL